MEQILLHKTYYYFLLGLSGALLVSLLKACPAIWRSFKGLSPLVWLLAGFFLLLGVVLRLLAPRALQVYYDEFYYISIADNLARHQIATYFWHTSPLSLQNYPHFFPPYPVGWSFLLSGLFKLVAPGLTAAQNLSLFLSCLSLPLGFAAAYFCWGKARSALAYMLLLALLPVSLKLSKAAALEGANFFFLSLALAALFFYLKYPGKLNFYLSLFSFCLWLHFRAENLLFLIPYLYLVRRDLGDTKAWLVLILSLLPLAVIYAAALHYPDLAEHFKSIPRQSVPSWEAQFFLNFWHNVIFYFKNYAQPLSFTLFFILGFYLNQNPKGYGLALWWLGLFTFWAAFPFGDLACVYSLDSWRFSLALAPPFLLLAAEGASRLCSFPKGLGLLVGLFLLSCSYLSAKSFITESHPYLKQYNFLCSLKSLLPEQSWVITEHPDYALALSYGAAVPTLLYPLKQEGMLPKYNYYLLSSEVKLERWKRYRLNLIKTLDADELSLSLWKLSP
jgi:hypothetical protein